MSGSSTFLFGLCQGRPKFSGASTYAKKCFLARPNMRPLLYMYGVKFCIYKCTNFEPLKNGVILPDICDRSSFVHGMFVNFLPFDFFSFSFDFSRFGRNPDFQMFVKWARRQNCSVVRMRPIQMPNSGRMSNPGPFWILTKFAFTISLVNLKYFRCKRWSLKYGKMVEFFGIFGHICSFYFGWIYIFSLVAL